MHTHFTRVTVKLALKWLRTLVVYELSTPTQYNKQITHNAVWFRSETNSVIHNFNGYFPCNKQNETKIFTSAV